MQQNYSAKVQLMALPLSTRLKSVSTFLCPTRGHREPTALPAWQPWLGAVGDYAGNVGDAGSIANPSLGVYVQDCWPVDYPINKGPRANGTMIATHAVYYANGQVGRGSCGNELDSQLVRWDLPVRFKSIKDGLSKTLLFGEKYVPQNQLGKQGLDAGGVKQLDQSVWSANGTPDVARAGGPGLAIAGSMDEPVVTAEAYVFGSHHPDICQFVMSDGSVHAINVTIDTMTLGYLCNRHDGKELTGEL